MDAVQFNAEEEYDFNLQQSVVEVINSKIQKADLDLNHFLAKLHNPNQTPGRASDQDPLWIDAQRRSFDVIESSSRFRTKLFYLRIRVTEFNSTQVLNLVSSSRLNDLSLEEIKEEIK